MIDNHVFQTVDIIDLNTLITVYFGCLQQSLQEDIWVYFGIDVSIIIILIM